MGNERAYATVDRALYERLEDLSDDGDKPFYREGYPKADIHLKLLEQIPGAGRAESAVSAGEPGQLSRRRSAVPAGRRARPPAGLDYTYADLDLGTLGNPLQDFFGFVVHMGELLNGKAHQSSRPAEAAGQGRG